MDEISLALNLGRRFDAADSGLELRGQAKVKVKVKVSDVSGKSGWRVRGRENRYIIKVAQQWRAPLAALGDAATLLTMSLLQNIKPFWPLLVTFILPRAYGYFRALRVAYRTRPQPQPLSRRATISINLLFGAICIFLVASFSTFAADKANVFILTNSRLAIPSDVLFSRLSSIRPGQTLTPSDERLLEKLTTTSIRKLYLRFGPLTVIDCPFCTPLDQSTYLLYHFPRNIVLPHLFNFGILGLATSATFSGIEASAWRLYVLVGALILAGCDAYYVVTYSPSIDANMPGPAGLYWVLAILRPLALCFYDALVAFIIYASATKRFLLFSGPPKDPKVIQQHITELINKSGMTMSSATTKMRAANLARNAVVRNSDLKQSEDQYWQHVVDLEGPQDLHSGVFEDEEVQAALARAYGSGTVNVEKIRKEADGFVKGVTQGLNQDTGATSS